MTRYFFLLVAWTLGCCLAAALVGLTALQQPPADTPSPQPTPQPQPLRRASPPEERQFPPPDDALHVWQRPEKGYQSVLVLRVIDGDTFEGAFLVPVRIRVWGVNAPELKETGGARSKEAVKRLLEGKLATADLRGHDPYGRVVGDVWLKPNPEDPGQPAGWLSGWLLRSGYARRWPEEMRSNVPSGTGDR
jgi:micrococcal nuclease